VQYQDDTGADLNAAPTDKERAYFNQFWFRFGVVADIPIGKGLSVRAPALLGFKVLNSAEKAGLPDARDNAASASCIGLSFEAGVVAGRRL
jgi:hypothetical protein